MEETTLLTETQKNTAALTSTMVTLTFTLFTFTEVL